MLTTLQSRLREIVAAEPLLTGRPVLIEDKNNLVAIVEAALAVNSLAVVVSPVSGTASDSQPRASINSVETFEVVIHRSPIDAPDTPSTVEVLQALRKRIQGAPVNPAHPAAPASVAFRYVSHQLRELGDGNYARALIVAANDTH